MFILKKCDPQKLALPLCAQFDNGHRNNTVSYELLFVIFTFLADSFKPQSLSSNPDINCLKPRQAPRVAMRDHQMPQRKLGAWR